MKTIQRYWARLAAAAGAGLALLTLLIHNLAWGDAPGLQIRLGTNQLSLTVTNGTPGRNYEIYWSEFLDTNALAFTNNYWLLVTNGAANQTNFVLTMPNTWTGFYRAVNTNDLDGDGILDFDDADPFGLTNDLLRVTIEIPGPGALVQ